MTFSPISRVRSVKPERSMSLFIYPVCNKAPLPTSASGVTSLPDRMLRVQSLGELANRPKPSKWKLANSIAAPDVLVTVMVNSPALVELRRPLESAYPPAVVLGAGLKDWDPHVPSVLALAAFTQLPQPAPSVVEVPTACAVTPLVKEAS